MTTQSSTNQGNNTAMQICLVNCRFLKYHPKFQYQVRPYCSRSFVWWPQIDTDLEELVKNCDDCQSTRRLPPAAPLQPWEWPQKPWARVHADYAGPFLNKYFSLWWMPALSG